MKNERDFQNKLLLTCTLGTRAPARTPDRVYTPKKVPTMSARRIVRFISRAAPFYNFEMQFAMVGLAIRKANKTPGFTNT